MTPSRSALGRHGRQFALFSAVGVFNTAVDFVVFIVCVFAGVAPVVANVGAFAVANPVSYLINSRLTFRRNRRPAAISINGYVKFLAAHIVSLVASTACVWVFAAMIGPIWAKLAAVAVTVAINYSTSAIFVFGSQK